MMNKDEMISCIVKSNIDKDCMVQLINIINDYFNNKNKKSMPDLVKSDSWGQQMDSDMLFRTGKLDPIGD